MQSALRTQKGCDGMAKKCTDCSWRYIQAIEQGNRIPSLKWLNKLSEKLNVPLATLVKE